MAPDARSTPEPTQDRGWTAFERGAFIFGRCDTCGFESPGRRARYSVEADLCAHEVLCRAEALVGDVSHPRAPEPAPVER